MYRLLILLILLLSAPFTGKGQHDSTGTKQDTLILNTVTIQDNAKGCLLESVSSQDDPLNLYNTFNLNEVRRATSLTQLLEKSNGISIRSYSPGGLTSVAYRGTTSAQTNLYWNGLPIISTQNGLFDANLVPAYLFDFASMSSSVDGIGGHININSTIIDTAKTSKNTQSLNIRSGIGSFGWQEQGLQVQMKEGQVSASFRIFNQQAVNDFTFYNRATLQEQTQTNARFNLQAAVFNVDLNFSEKDSTYKYGSKYHHLSLSGWVQKAERQIAPTLLSAQTSALQQDRSIRIAMDYYYSKNRNDFSFDFGVNYDYLLYQDTNAKIYAPYNSGIINGNIYYLKRIEHRKNTTFFHVSLYNQLQKASAIAYQIDRSRLLTAPKIRLSHHFNYGQKFITLFIKHQFISDQKGLWNYGIAYAYERFKKLKAQFSAERTFRLPTFNDLYWTPGGNPNLLPEKCWKTEFNFGKYWVKDLYDKNRGYVLIRENIYSKVIENGIVWLPTAGYWSPVNVATIWARGIESKMTIEQRLIYPYRLKIEASYDYCRSTPIKTVLANDASLHKQVMYIPVHQAQGSIELTRNTWSLRFRHSYTGVRFIVTDESDFLPSFSLGELSLEKSLMIHKKWLKKADFRLEILNLYNTYFEAVALRPQPGRHFRFTLELDW